MRDPDFTLTAGPTAASPATLAALGSPITYHYDPVFLEAAARSLVRPGMRVLNLASGVFGKGMGTRLKALGADVAELEVAYNDVVDPGAVADYLDAHPGIELVAVVHSETPSGTLHDCSAIGPIARAQ